MRIEVIANDQQYVRRTPNRRRIPGGLIGQPGIVFTLQRRLRVRQILWGWLIIPFPGSPFKRTLIDPQIPTNIQLGLFNRKCLRS